MEYSSEIERDMDLLLMLDVKVTVDKLAMANCLSWYGHVLRRADGHVEKGIALSA